MLSHSNESEFALCLTHDVDRPYKTYQALADVVTNRSLGELRTLVTEQNPYWQFQEIMELESELGVRSAFYFLNERHLLGTSPRNWLSPTNWVQHFGSYDVTDDEIQSVMRELVGGGWEVGLHGSFHSCDDPDRLKAEKTTLELILGGSISGGRQHYLRLDGTDTWRSHREIGLDYDTSLGSATDCGFAHGYGVTRPFGDEFVVFPITIMDQALPAPGSRFEAAWAACERLLDEAAANDAVMTVLWHPRLFNESEFPGYRRLYRRLVERALEMDAWVGPPGVLYEAMESPRDAQIVLAADETYASSTSPPSSPEVAVQEVGQ